MTAQSPDHAKLITQHGSVGGKHPTDIACELAADGFAPNDVLSAIESLGLGQSAISVAVTAAFPGIPRQNRVVYGPNVFLGPDGPNVDVGGVHADIGGPPHMDLLTAHTDVMGQLDLFAAGHTDTYTHADAVEHEDVERRGGHVDAPPLGQGSSIHNDLGLAGGQ